MENLNIPHAVEYLNSPFKPPISYYKSDSCSHETKQG